METLEGVVLQLNIKGGLAHLTIQYPTAADIQTYPMIEVTSDLPWNPEGLDNEGDRYIQELKVEQEGPNLELICPCLGRKPVEVIKKHWNPPPIMLKFSKNSNEAPFQSKKLCYLCQKAQRDHLH